MIIIAKWRSRRKWRKKRKRDEDWEWEEEKMNKQQRNSRPSNSRHYMLGPSHISTHLVSSVQFSHSVVSDSLRPHESQHARPPCPSPSPGIHSDSRPSSPWCHPAISSSVVPFSSCPQSLPASWPVPVSWLFTSGGQSIGVSATLLPMNIQDRFPLGLTGMISLLSKGLSRVNAFKLWWWRILLRLK